MSVVAYQRSISESVVEISWFASNDGHVAVILQFGSSAPLTITTWPVFKNAYTNHAHDQFLWVNSPNLCCLHDKKKNSFLRKKRRIFVLPMMRINFVLYHHYPSKDSHDQFNLCTHPANVFINCRGVTSNLSSCSDQLLLTYFDSGCYRRW